jgi:hypothetical protein
MEKKHMLPLPGIEALPSSPDLIAIPAHVENIT